MSRSVSAFRLVAAAVLLSGCGGAQSEPASPTPARSEVLPEDQSFSARPIEIHGIAFVPEALEHPAMPAGPARGRATLDQQRKRVAGRSRPAAADVERLVGLLWDEADSLKNTGAEKDTDADKERALREEGRTALRSLRAQSPGKTDEIALQMLVNAEVWLGDDAAAASALEELSARFPDGEGQTGRRAYLAYLYLRTHKLADATNLTRDWKPDRESDVGAYVLAWVAFVGGDQDRARRAIATAAATWKDDRSRADVERDLVLILARSGTDVAEAARLVGEAAAGDAQRRYVWMFKLSEAYKFAGDYDAASRALDVIVDELAREARDPVPADDLVGFRYRQADYAFRLNRPGEAAERAMQAQKQLAACGAKCPDDTSQAVMERILKLAQFSHTVYAKSLDSAHYDAAVALYQHYIAMPGRPDVEAARGYLSSLQETRATAEPGAGKHDQDVLLNYFWARREVVAACYEKQLLAEPTLDGALTLTIEIDARGAVTGAKSEPGAGAAGLAAVAGCVVERARAWTFPTRTVPGKTTLVAPLQFKLQQPGDVSTPAPPAKSGPDDGQAPAGQTPAEQTPAQKPPAQKPPG